MSEAAAAAADDDTTKVNLVSASIAAYVLWFLFLRRAETGEPPHARWLLLPRPRPRAARRLCTGTKVGAVGWDGTGDISLLSDRRRSGPPVGLGTAFHRAGAGRGTLLPPRPMMKSLCVCWILGGLRPDGHD